MGKKTPLYSGGNNPTVTPLSSLAESGTTAGVGGTTAEERYYRLLHLGGTTDVARGTTAGTSQGKLGEEGELH